MKKKRTPAEYLIEKMGSMRQIARDLKISPSTVMRWKEGSGFVPQKYWDQIALVANKKGIAISMEKLSGIN